MTNYKKVSAIIPISAEMHAELVEREKHTIPLFIPTTIFGASSMMPTGFRRSLWIRTAFDVECFPTVARVECFIQRLRCYGVMVRHSLADRGLRGLDRIGGKSWYSIHREEAER